MGNACIFCLDGKKYNSDQMNTVKKKGLNPRTPLTPVLQTKTSSLEAAYNPFIKSERNGEKFHHDV